MSPTSASAGSSQDQPGNGQPANDQPGNEQPRPDEDPAGSASSDRPLIKELRTPAAAGVAGLIFSGILMTVLVLFHTSVPQGGGSGQWLGEESRRQAVQTALALIPFAGISFLWFMGVVRTRLGSLEDRLFATVLLGSGLLFVGILFVTAAVLASALSLYSQGVPTSSEAILTLQVLTGQLMGTFGARMAAVFVFSVTSIGARTGLVPRWLVVVGLLTGVFLLASPPVTPWVQVAFPTWVLLLSCHILIVSRKRRAV